MTTKTEHSRKVVTWGSGGATIDICEKCQERLEAAGTWPKDARGREYCQVQHGLHYGYCEYDD